jgi:cytochrome c
MTVSRTVWAGRRLSRVGLGVVLWLGIAGVAGADMVGHGGMVRSVAISPDGTRVLTASFDYTARLWDFVEQTELGVLEEHDAPVNAGVFLPDGRRVLTASDDGSLILWDVTTFKMLRRFTGHGAKVMAVAASPDGRLAASGSWDKTLRLWDIANGAELRVIPQPTAINAVAFTPAGDAVLTGGHDGILRLWDTESGRFLFQLNGHDWGVTQIVLSPDGRMALSSGTDAKVKLWDVKARRKIAEYDWHDGPVLGVAFAPDGRSALSTGRDGSIVHWNLARSTMLRRIPAHDQPTWAVAFSPDGRFALSAGTDERVRVWHLETGDRIGLTDEGMAEAQPWLESDHPGARLFTKCARCHSLNAEGIRRSGPHLSGLFGRRVGSVPGYKYSRALRDADFAWTEQTLFALFDKGPDAYLPGTKMPVQRVTDSDRLKDLIGYLRQVTAPDATTRK